MSRMLDRDEAAAFLLRYEGVAPDRLVDGSWLLGRCISVTGVEGCFYGPGLSWPEAVRLIERGHIGSADQRLLLLLRTLGDADTPATAVRQAAGALLAVGNTTCSYDVAAEAARQLLEDETRGACGTGSCSATGSTRFADRADSLRRISSG